MHAGLGRKLDMNLENLQPIRRNDWKEDLQKLMQNMIMTHELIIQTNRLIKPWPNKKWLQPFDNLPYVRFQNFINQSKCGRTWRRTGARDPIWFLFSLVISNSLCNGFLNKQLYILKKNYVLPSTCNLRSALSKILHIQYSINWDLKAFIVKG